MDLDLEDLWLQGKASTDIGISGTNDFNTNSGTFSPFEIDTASQSLLNGVSGRPIMSYSGADLVDSSFDDGISFQKRATSPLASVGKFAPSQLSSLNTNFGVDSMLTNDGFDDDVGLYLNEPRRQTSAQTPLNSSSLSSSSSSTLASVSMSTSSSSFVMPGVTNVAPSQSINSTTISTRPHIALDNNDFDEDEEEEEEEEEEEIEKPIKGAGTRASTRDRRGSKASSTGGGTYLKSEEKERKERTSFVGMTDEERKATRLLRNRESARQSRQRKKQYIDLLESRVSTLQVQVQEKRILHASSAPHILDEQRQMLVLALEPLATRSVNGIPLSIEEEATLVDAASQLIDRFGPDCAERRASRDFFFDQLQRILLPPHTKFLLWLMNQPESFFGESVHSVADSVARLLPNGGEYNSDDAATLPPTTTASQTALWGLFCSQIGLTLEQADKFKQQLRSIFHLSETPVEIWRLGIAMTYLQRLRSAISGMAASTHNQYVKAREILSPAQLILFVAWTERNKDRLSHNVEQILTVSVPKS
jgi:hypothetical protein